MRILVADDSPVFQNVLKVMLTNWGYDVELAYDGEEAWQMLQGEDGPHLAILDWMMPGMEGIEVCRRIRANPPNHDVYLVILTSRMGSEDLTAAMEAGADDFVTKPLKSHELRVRLHVACQILEPEDPAALLREHLMYVAGLMDQLGKGLRRLAEITGKRSHGAAGAGVETGAELRPNRSHRKAAGQRLSSMEAIGDVELTAERLGSEAQGKSDIN